MTLLATHHVQLAMPPGGEARARAFYGELLELEELPKPAPLAARGGVWFRARAAGGSAENAAEALLVPEVHLGVEQDFRPARKAHPGFLVHDLASLRARLAAAGVPLTDGESLPGLARFHAEDPFGNRLEFLARVTV